MYEIEHFVEDQGFKVKKSRAKLADGSDTLISCDNIEMSSVVSGFKTMCRKATAVLSKSSRRTRLCTATCALPVGNHRAHVGQEVCYRMADQQCHSVPLTTVLRGNLHKHFYGISKDYGHFTGINLMRKKFVVLNSHKAVVDVLENAHSDDRMSPFFQEYVLKTGFSFSDFSETGEKQKEVLKSFLYHNVVHGNKAIMNVVGDTVEALVKAPETIDPDLYVKQFLSNMFTHLVRSLDLFVCFCFVLILLPLTISRIFLLYCTFCS